MNIPKAECAAIPSNVKLVFQLGSLVKTKDQHPYTSFRLYSRSFKAVPLTLLSVRKQNALCIQKFPRPSKRSFWGCSCLGSLINSEFDAVSDWVTAVNQTLLVASMFLAYTAGIIPTGKPSTDSQNKLFDDLLLPNYPDMQNCATDTDEQANCVWNTVKKKLTDSLDVFERFDNLENKRFEMEQQNLKQPLSLYAVSGGPRFRLLWSSLEQLEKEVNELPDSFQTVTRNEIPLAISNILRKTCQPACISWIKEEFSLENCDSDTALLLSLSEKLKGDNVILQNIVKSGKMDLYAGLLFFLRYGICREDCLYDRNLYFSHGDSILEDLVITISDGIASLYLELISVDGDISDRVNNLGLRLCAVSTRTLQKIRNQVTMNQWLYQNFEAVASMYEDRFDLRTLQSQLFEESTKNYDENLSWWRKFTRKKSATSKAPLYYNAISHFSLSVKRTKELRALQGGKYYYSLFLELYDILEPLGKALITQVSRAISFLLVTLIGRSLGLVYTGIKQSLRWK